MGEIKEIAERRRLCNCAVCKIAYEVIDFTNLLIDDEMLKKIYSDEELAELGKEGFISLNVLRHQTVGRVLSNACAEHMFTHAAAPEYVANWFATAWNNRMVKLANGEQQSEISVKLEDYQS